MDSSKEIDVRKVNLEIIEAFQKKGALDAQRAIFVEDLELNYSLKLIYYLIEEFVRNDFMKVLEDGKVYFNQNKYRFEKKKTQGIYIAILFIPFIIGVLLILM